jgi:hypothetical protein
MTTPTQQLAQALAWLRDLSNPPDTRPDTAAGREWLQRLALEMQDAGAKPEELVEAARDLARAGGFFPTPGAIVERIRDLRLARVRAERESNWRDERERPAAPVAARLADGGHPPDGWTTGRSMVRDHEAISDLVRRGHGGLDGQQREHYVVAMLREEAEAAAARARGEAWAPPRYGPSLVGLLRVSAGLRGLGVGQ